MFLSNNVSSGTILLLCKLRLWECTTTSLYILVLFSPLFIVVQI